MRKSPISSICRNTLNLFDEIVVDNFAGGGGASTGMCADAQVEAA